jgi:hypothetical protein
MGCTRLLEKGVIEKFNIPLKRAHGDVQTVKRYSFVRSYERKIGLFHIVFHETVENREQYW